MTVAAPYKQNTVVLKGRGYHEDAPAGGTIQPGALIQRQPDGSVVVHAVQGGRSEKLWAKEDALQGKWFNDTYTATVPDLVSYYQAVMGDHILALIATAAPAITTGSPLISNGDGTLIGLSSVGGTVIYDNPAASVPITNVAVETAFSLNYPIPANSLLVGDVIKIHFSGTQTAQNSTNTLGIKVYIGGLTGTALVTIAPAVGAANNVFDGDIELIVRSIGPTGTFVASCNYTAVPAASGTATRVQTEVPSTAIDTTAVQAIAVSATWSVASPGNSVRLDELVVELVRGAPSAVVAYAGVAVDNHLGTGPVYSPVVAA